MIATFVTAWVLVFNSSLETREAPVVVQGIANYEACMQLGRDMKGERRQPYYGCFAYPIVVGGSKVPAQ